MLNVIFCRGGGGRLKQQQKEDFECKTWRGSAVQRKKRPIWTTHLTVYTPPIVPESITFKYLNTDHQVVYFLIILTIFLKKYNITTIATMESGNLTSMELLLNLVLDGFSSGNVSLGTFPRVTEMAFGEKPEWISFY